VKPGGEDSIGLKRKIKKRNHIVSRAQQRQSLSVFITWTMEAAMTKASVASYHEMQGFYVVLIF